MSRANYAEALRRLLGHEGGYANHPSDPGGPTKFGITLADYRKYVKPNATAADMRAMRIEEAEAIYRKHYWNALRCDDLPAGVDYAVFDYGVNSGIARAARVLRRALGLSAGAVDEEALAAARAADAGGLVTAICEERIAFLKRLKTWPVFGAGWSRRVAEVRAAALAMARLRGAEVAAPATQARAAPAQSPQKPVVRRPVGWIARVAAAVAAPLGAAQALDGARAVALALIFAAAAAAAVVGWRYWRRRRHEEI